MKMPKLDLTLDLECWSDELSPAQLAVYEKAQAEHSSLNEKLKDLLVINDGEEIFSGDLFSAYQFIGDVRVPDSSTVSATSKKTLDKAALDKSIKSETSTTTRAYKRKTPDLPPDDDDDEDLPLIKRAARSKEKNQPAKVQQTPKDKRTRTSKVNEKEKVSSPSFRPSELTSIGGLTVGVDVKDDNNKSGPDTKEVTFNKLQGKTFPSLVVLARPSLRVKDSSNLERNALDSKVKIVLMLTPAKFTEWLIQQGLLKSEQKCAVHRENDLKLGVYSDGSKFPYSGGYVWISECCPTRFVSVFHGSLFEGAPNPPSCILKLIYHWSCQTNIQNVVQWVKVDNMYIKGVYTWLRAICTLAIHKHFKPMGGSGKYVEVGVISLGTTAQDGAQRQVKVEVLGILDHAEKTVRLRAIEPFNDADRNYKKRFAKILEPLESWVLHDSTVVIDMTVDKSTLHSMGFRNVIQSSATDTSAKHTNGAVMDYLRRIVPRMFQNTLSLLSRQMIQQFLDELVWREQYGTFPLQTFDSITTHISEQTKLYTSDTLIQRLFQVATNPFKDWNKSPVETDLLPQKDSPTPSVAPRRGRKPAVKDSLTSNSTMKMTTDVGHIEKERETTASSPKSGRTNFADYSDVHDKSFERNESNWGPRKGPQSQEKVIDDFGKKNRTGLEELYYGISEGSERNFEYLANLSTACPICGQTFESNLQLQNDLMSHVKNANLDDSLQLQCVLCLDRFGDSAAMRKHEKLVHPMRTKSASSHTFNCIICQNRFNSTVMLELHLRKNHIRLEMPYKCGGCGYRSSSHKNAILHFHQKHDKTNMLQCPFCLHITRIYEGGICLTDKIQSYYLHLQQHQLKSENKKCNKCVLVFLHKGVLKLHQMLDHNSFFGNPNVKCLLKSTLMVPYPRVKQTIKEDPQYTEIELFEQLNIATSPSQLCAECDSEFKEDHHIVGVLRCLKCRYQTCCLRTILDHTANCQSEINPESNVHIILDKEMHCVCGFSSLDGNSLARHLAVCEHKSAYPSAEIAQENTVKRNMLDMLGLVRRDGDPGRNDSSNTLKSSSGQNSSDDISSEKVTTTKKQKLCELEQSTASAFNFEQTFEEREPAGPEDLFCKYLSTEIEHIKLDHILRKVKMDMVTLVRDAIKNDKEERELLIIPESSIPTGEPPIIPGSSTPTGELTIISGSSTPIGEPPIIPESSTPTGFDFDDIIEYEDFSIMS